jgi:hypothetical protein
MMVVVKIVLGALVAVLLVVVAVPAVVLMDLVLGGTGLGMCREGLGACSTSMFGAMELLLVMLVFVTVIGAGVAGCFHLLSRSQRRQSAGR